MTQIWQQDDGLTDVTAAFKGITHPLSDLVDDIHRRGWTVSKIYIKDGTYVALGKSPHKETIEATGRTDATAAANLLVKIMRREFMRAGAVREKLGAWDHRPFEQQLPEIAIAYAGAPVYEPKAATAWMELAQDCGRRAQAIRLQLSIEYTDDPVPYESANDMREDVTEKRHVMITRAYAHHPVWSEQQMLDYRLVVDTLGHTVGGADWGWHGTCMAFAALAPLFADVAQKALYTELLGQTAFGTFYRQWGPQKICFLEDLVEDAQKENKPGHTGIHPSQSIVPMATPSVFSKVAADEHSLQWLSGSEGKGWLMPDGQVLTWNTQNGQPHHGDAFLARGLNPSYMPVTNQQTGEWRVTPHSGVPFNIDPSGVVIGQGNGEPLAPEHMRRLRALSRDFRAPSLRRRSGPARVAMAERTGDPALDAAIYEFMSEHRGELGNIQDYRHPQVAWGQCEVVAEECAEFLRSKGFKASNGDGDLDELGYQDAQKSEDVGAGDFTYPEHSVVCIYNEHGIVWWTIDFTAAQYGYEEFPKVEPGPAGPLVGPQPESFTSAVQAQQLDPNGEWESGVQPLPDAGYLWQRENGTDPLDAQAVTDNLRPLDTGIANQHPGMAKQSVINALRGSLLGSRTNPMGHAIHYQDLMHVPADVDDPIAYWNTLEQKREAWNQAKGYAPESHKQYWPQEQMFKQWVKAMNPEMDDGDVQRLSKREMLHMLTEEEERIVAQDPGEQLSTEDIEHEAYEALKRRLGSLTKGKTDQKVDFGTDHLFHEARTARGPGMQWTPGSWGKGMIVGNQLHSWNTDRGGSPHHYELLEQIHDMPLGDDEFDWEPGHHYTAPIVISPDGWYHDDSPEPDPSVTRFAQAHPALKYVRDASTWQRRAYGAHTATHHADMYPPYLASRLRPIAHVSRYAKELAEAARQDLVSHKGHGHHFRAKALSLGIPQLGPRQVSNAWLHLAPQTSQLGVIEPHVMEALGHDHQTDDSKRDYFKHERELAAGRDAAGYGHVPLGAFSAGLYDLGAGGPGWHPDRTPFKVQSPPAPHLVNWAAQTPEEPGWQDPYWWQSTQEARDAAAKDFDRTVAINHRADEVPFEHTAHTSMRYDWDGNIVPYYTKLPDGTRVPYLIDPPSGERITGAPGQSIMQHVQTTMGHTDPREVWAQNYEVGKDAAPAPGTIAKVASFSDQDVDQFLDGYMEAALWSSTDDEGQPLDANYGFEHIDPVTLAAMRQEAVEFLQNHEASIEQYVAAGRSLDEAGHDFWLTRNHHGTGFWDRGLPGSLGNDLTNASQSHGESDLYLGDDQYLHGSNYGDAYEQQGLAQMADPQNWQHPDPWMDSEPGATTFPEGWARWGRRRRSRRSS